MSQARYTIKRAADNKWYWILTADRVEAHE
jgi:hypothetical protein